MLAKPYRLRQQNDIRATLRQGKVRRARFIVVYVRSHPDQPVSRVACVVGKKVDPSAVVRHKYQRWLREIIKQLLPTLPYTADIVIVALPPIAHASRDSLRQQVRQALEKPLESV